MEIKRIHVRDADIAREMLSSGGGYRLHMEVRGTSVPGTPTYSTSGTPQDARSRSGAFTGVRG